MARMRKLKNCHNIHPSGSSYNIIIIFLFIQYQRLLLLLLHCRHKAQGCEFSLFMQFNAIRFMEMLNYTNKIIKPQSTKTNNIDIE